MSLTLLLESALRAIADVGRAGPKAESTLPETRLAARESAGALVPSSAANYAATAAKQSAWAPGAGMAARVCNEPANARTLTWANAEPVQRQSRQLLGWHADDRANAALRRAETAGHVPSYAPDGAAQRLYGFHTVPPPKGYTNQYTEIGAK
jgi:hypothetical protein